MSVFSEGELDYLAGERRLARIATVGKDRTPNVVPVGFGYNPDHGSRPLIRIHPERIVPWGLDADGSARSVTR